MTTALHVSPHPDDEVLGAGGTLGLLRRNGWTVVNLACGLGRPAQHDRRLAELREATSRAGIELKLCDPLLRLSADDDLAEAEDRLVVVLGRLLQNSRASLVLGPHAHDGHHAHEVVARSIARAVEQSGTPLSWWAWGFWSDLPRPNLYVPLEHDDVARLEHIMAAYQGESQRNDYVRLLQARATVSAVLGSERVFGYGRPAADPAPFAELLEEHRFDPHHGWIRSAPRILSEEELRNWAK